MVEPGSERGVLPAQTIARASRGDAQAWRAIVGELGPRLFALARSRLGTADAAEELVQAVFVSVSRQLSSGGYVERGWFEAWVFRIAINRIRDEVRRRRSARATMRRIAQLRADAQERSADESHRDAEPGEIVRMRAALERLPHRDREILELRHHGGMSFAQMSALLSEPLGTLLARHHRALRKLRAMIEDAGGSTGAEEREGARP